MLRTLGALWPPPPAPGAPGDPGLFGPASEVWRVARHRALLVGGQAALLMQIAHPLVAAGVAAHSGFRADPLQRLRTTLDVTLRITFGDTRQARAAAAGARSTHRRVRGRAADGTPYAATDPHLALWVHATLVTSALEVTEMFVEPLGPDRQDRYHDEMKLFAGAFGVPRDLVPRSYADLKGYVDDMVADVLRVGPVTKELADQVVRGVPAPPPARRLAAAVAAGLLPPRLRAAYRLPWGRPERAAAATLARTARAGTPLLPDRLRYWPHYTAAVTRITAVTADTARRPDLSPGS